MKKRVLSVMASCCFLALSAVATVQAQLPGTAMRATIPFDFSVRGKMLPAGVYEIRRVTDEPDVLVMSNVDNNHERIVFETERVDESRISSKSELVFNRYNDDYFLSEVFTAGEQTGRESIPSHRERALQREMASNGQAKSETVAVAAY
jgi:hypothetical protein